MRLSNSTRLHYKGVVAGIAIDQKTGEMSLGWEILMPPFDYDLGDAGKAPAMAGPSGPVTTPNGRPESWKLPPRKRIETILPP